MPPKAKRPTRKRTNSGIDTRKLETLIREAVRSELISQSSRTQTTESYTKRLQDTDSKVTSFIEQAINETTRAYRLAIDTYRANQYSALLVLVTGLLLSFVLGPGHDFFVLALLVAGCGLIWNLFLQGRSPVKHTRQIVDHLARLNVIFAGYIRQVHQIDSVFEELIRNGKGISPQTAEQLLNNIQDTMTDAMNAISATASDLDP